MAVNTQQRELAQHEARAARLRKTIRLTLIYGLMIFLGFIFLFPIIFMIVASLKPNDRVIADLSSVAALLPNPSILTLDNFKDVFDRVPFDRYAFTSLFITFVTVFVGMFVNSMAAFVLSRMRWIGRSTMLAIVVSLIIIPLEAIAIPLMMEVNTIGTPVNLVLLVIIGSLTFMLWLIFWNALDGVLPVMSEGIRLPLRAVLTAVLALPLEILVYLLIRQTLDGGTWLNTYHVQIIPFLADPFSIFLFYQFFIGVPKDFDEAATVDGATYLRVYWQIIVPISRPVFATVAILKFLQFWSFYMWPLMVTRSDEFRPLMVGMDFFRTQEPIQWGSIMGYAAMVTIPVLIVFLLFQKWFVASVSSSGVKG